jgi:hypothetical protein
MNALVNTFIAAVAALALGALITGGWQPAVSSLMGAAGTSGYLYCSWLLVRTIGAGYGGDGHKPPHPLLIFGAVLFKLPLIYGGWLLAQRLGPLGPGFFLAGLALVYCALVGWSVHSNKAD